MREVNYDERWKVARDLACKIHLWPTVENLRHLDAALRRAKAEGAREMIKIVKANRADQRVADDLNNTVSFDSFNEVLDAITREADARAAQIEEVEHGQT